MGTALKNIKTPKSGDRVLWIRYWAFGDVLQAAADAKQFKALFPDTHLTFLTKPLYAGLLSEQPWCDDVIAGDKKPFGKFMATLSDVRSGRFDWVVSTHHGGHTALMCLMSGVENRVGTVPFFPFAYKEGLSVFLKRVGITPETRPESVISVSGDNAAAAEIRLAGLPRKKLTAIIGASSDVKKWPLDNWVCFLRKVLAEGWGVILVGDGESEENFASELQGRLSHENVCDLTGKLSITELAGVVSVCDVAVGNDTGTLHLSALSGVPTIGLADYDQFRSVGFTMRNFIGLSMAPESEYAKTRKRSRELLAAITPEVVWNALEELCTEE